MKEPRRKGAKGPTAAHTAITEKTLRRHSGERRNPGNVKSLGPGLHRGDDKTVDRETTAVIMGYTEELLRRHSAALRKRPLLVIPARRRKTLLVIPANAGIQET
jgi:hypothetical protein